MKRTRSRSTILNGSPFQAISALLWPLLMCGIFQQLYTTVDGIVIGKNLGAYAHAIIGGSPSNLIGIFNNLSSGLISGALVVAAQANGANDTRRKISTVSNGLFLVTALSVVMMAVYFFSGKLLLSFLKVPEDLLEDSFTYLRIYLWGFVPYSITMLLINLQRGMGETRRPNFMLMFNYVMYIVFDILFVIILKMGMVGVPCAYIATYSLSTIIMLAGTIRDYHLLDSKHFIDGKTVVEIVRVGLPAAITSVFFALSTTLITTCMNRLGGDVVAAYSIANKVAGIMWIIMSAVTTATITMVATNYGAGRIKRIAPTLKASMAISMSFTALLWIICKLWGTPLLTLFTDDVTILEEASGVLDFLTLMYFLYPALDVYGAALKGTGHAMTATWITLVCVGGIRFGWLLGFPHLLTNVYMVLLAFPMAWGLTSISSFIAYLMTRKKQA